MFSRTNVASRSASTARGGLLTEFGKSTLSDRYLMNGGCLGGSKGAAKG
jgi:hypothetical protein